MGRFNELKNELDGKQHKTEMLQYRDLPGIKNIMCAICVDYINYHEWDITVHPGSITFQKKNDDHQVIKIFVDYKNDLADKIGVSIPEYEPLVIGLELGHLDPFTRKQIRRWLRKANSAGTDYYIDPVKYVNRQKTLLQPAKKDINKNHYYDILFLREIPCKYEEDGEVISMVDCFIDDIVRKSYDNL